MRTATQTWTIDEPLDGWTGRASIEICGHHPSLQKEMRSRPFTGPESGVLLLLCGRVRGPGRKVTPEKTRAIKQVLEAGTVVKIQLRPLRTATITSGLPRVAIDGPPELRFVSRSRTPAHSQRSHRFL